MFYQHAATNFGWLPNQVDDISLLQWQRLVAEEETPETELTDAQLLAWGFVKQE